MFGLPQGIDSDDAVDRLSLSGVVLPDADDAVAGRVKAAVGVAHLDIRGDGLRLSAVLLPVNPLVRVVGEVDHFLMDQERPASVFVNSGPHAVGLRRHVNSLAFRVMLDQHHAAALRWAHLHPIYILAVEGNLTQPNGPGHDQAGGNGRLP